MESILNGLKLLQMVNEYGEVKTFFGGKVTLTQILQFFAVLIIVALTIRLAKKIVRLVVTVICITFLCISFGVISPEQLESTENILSVAENVVSVKKITELSENVSFDGESVKLKLNDEWYSIDDIQSFTYVEEGVVSVSVAGKDISVTDESLIQLLELFREKK